MARHGLHFGVMVLSVLAVSPAWAQQGQRMADPVSFYFPGYDTNGDGKLDRQEWNRRGNFDLLDSNHDSGIDRDEFALIYGRLGQGRDPVSSPAPSAAMDDSVKADQVDIEAIGKGAFCIVARRGKCSDATQMATDNGLMPTGTGPVFPAGANCPGIDETFAESYEDKTGQGAHGGIDIPVEAGTPILAVADGTVVAVITNEFQARGLNMVLRHSPQDSGLPFWTYSEYAHLKTAPELVVGQRVSKGQIIAVTGNTGVKPNSKSAESKRRPAIHYAIYYSETPRFAVMGNYAIPEKPHWMDPVALYRNQAPYDSQSLLALPDAEKDVAVPVMMVDGSFSSPDAKRIWPYACRPLGQ